MLCPIKWQVSENELSAGNVANWVVSGTSAFTGFLTKADSRLTTQLRTFSTPVNPKSMALRAALLEILEFFASSPGEQIQYLTSGEWDNKYELDELIEDFFEELIPIMDAEGQWRSQFPYISKLYDTFPDKWWEGEAVSSIEALKSGAFWQSIRAIAKSALLQH